MINGNNFSGSPLFPLLRRQYDLATSLSPTRRQPAFTGACALLGLALCFSGCNKTVDDATLTTNVQTALRNDATISNQPVQVAVHGGTVTLTGTVSDPTAASVAANDAARVEGVKQVINSLSTASSAAATGLPPAAPGGAASTAATAPPPVVQQAPAPVAKSTSSAPVPAPAKQAPAPVTTAKSTAPAAPTYRDVTAPVGTVIPMRITESLSSANAQDGESFNGTTTASVVRDGYVILPAGSAVSGRVVAAKDAGHFKGNSVLSVELTAARRYGSLVDLSTSPYTLEGKGRGKNSALKIGGGAAAGALLGGLLGGGKGAAIGSLAGGGGGAAYQGFTRGQQVTIPSESVIRFRLSRPLTVRATERSSSSDSDSPTLQRR